MKMNSVSSSGKGLLFLTALLLVLAWASISIGSLEIPISETIGALFGDKESKWSDIVWEFRLPKTLTCILAGMALASSGLMMQTLFRNPLAGPDVLGLSSGASLLVAILILAGTWGASFLTLLSTSPWAIALAASIGSALVFSLVIVAAQKVKDNVSLLIIGLMIGAAASSMVMTLQFLSTADDLQAFVIWTMGSMGATSWGEINVLALIIMIGTGISLGSMKSLNALLLGENYAQSLGVKIQRSRLLIVLSTSLMSGAVTAFCGPIAFVGLAVPHLVRMILNTSNHKILLPAVMMAGASLVLLCDILAQLAGRTQSLPLNAITSLVGAPVVIWVVIRSRNSKI
jgi:iron complex transport system permease protein